MTGAIGSFAIGIVVAIAIAVAMTGVFEAATLGTAAREAAPNPAVHLDNVMPGRSASRSGSQP
jgi:FlaG/FlaF family flagellin (archaellin)